MIIQILKKLLTILAISIVFVYCVKENTSSPEIKLTLANLATNMVNVPGGSFTMGYTLKQQHIYIDGYIWLGGTPNIQQVTLGSYKICKVEVTQQLWLDVMGTNPSYFTGNLQRPVEMVSWDSCQSFITKLNQLTGLAYRLPTEAEWEYAARGGNNKDTYIYSGSDNVDAAAWYFGNSNYSTHAVGTKQANQLGLFDMSGNVREWCSDWFGNYSSSTVTNPSGPSSGLLRIDRGGSWGISKHWVQISDRSFHSPSESSRFFGFRLAQ